MGVVKLSTSEIRDFQKYSNMLAGNPFFNPQTEATGGTIVTTGGFRYHTFTGSGTFALTANPLNATFEYLVVAGGGGSGGTNGDAYGLTAGGAGGGGSVRFASATLTVGNYSVVVGGGGAGGVASNSLNPRETTVGDNGGNSSFNGLISNGGGGGGLNFIGDASADALQSGRVGGNGGGGSVSNNRSVSFTGGASNQGGFAGSESIWTGYNQRSSGGGGGAGGAVTPFEQIRPAENALIMLGGIGNGSYSTWATATSTGHEGRYASGGHGYTFLPSDVSYARSAGGGGGLTTNRGLQSGLPNTGGGASGSNQFNVQSGGSGIVIIRYPRT